MADLIYKQSVQIQALISCYLLGGGKILYLNYSGPHKDKHKLSHLIERSIMDYKQVWKDNAEVSNEQLILKYKDTKGYDIQGQMQILVLERENLPKISSGPDMDFIRSLGDLSFLLSSNASPSAGTSFSQFVTLTPNY